MAITKLRSALKREYVCSDCGAAVKVGDKYYDSDEPANPPKPFPVKKRCVACGDKVKGK